MDNHSMDDDHRISVVINTYNAERLLTEVLEAAIGFDEIVVCDMESTDHTLEIAEKYGCKIVIFPKGEHTIVEPARQFALDAASYPWILVVDADEIIPHELHDYLYEQIGKPNPPDGIYIPRQGYFMNKPLHLSYPDYQLRFFAKDKTTWPPIIHIQPEVNGKCVHIPKSRHDLALLHLANDTVSGLAQKANVYTDNDLNKKLNKNYGCMALVFRPIWKIFQCLFLEGGIRDGKRGLIKSVMNGYYQFLLTAKVIERKQDNLTAEKKEKEEKREEIKSE